MNKDVIILIFQYLNPLRYWFEYTIKYLKKEGYTNFKYNRDTYDIIINNLPIKFRIDPERQGRSIEFYHIGYRNPKVLEYAEFAFEKNFERTFKKLLWEE